jgi:hypothetical protein
MKCKRAKARRCKRKRWLRRVSIFGRVHFADWVHGDWSKPLVEGCPQVDPDTATVRVPIARVLKRDRAWWRRELQRRGFDVVD